MRQDIREILLKLASGEKPFFEQDSLPVNYQKICSDKIVEFQGDLKSLNEFFEETIAPIIFYSHNMYLANK